MVERHNGYGENSVDNMMVDYDYPPGVEPTNERCVLSI